MPGEFTLLYQPIFDLRDLHIEGVEALIRWNHPTKGTITPDRFIPVLEDSGQIVDVGRWVLNEACAQLARWQATGHRLAMSVNVSMRQLEFDGFVDDVRAALDTHGVAPEFLVIEITESVLMKDAHATVDRLTSLKDLGVKIAIDDFGTGYSSLAYLRQFPVDVLKIDRTFVSEMSGSPDAAALIHTLVELGRTLGLDHPGRGHRAAGPGRGTALGELRPRPGVPLLPARLTGSHRGAPGQSADIIAVAAGVPAPTPAG